MDRSEAFEKFYVIKDAQFDTREENLYLKKLLYQFDYDSSSQAKELIPSKTQLLKIKELLKRSNFGSIEAQKLALFWKYRYYLRDFPEALPKFLKSVRWTVPKVAEEAKELIPQWKPVSYDDALFLLSRTFSINPVYKTDLEIQEEDIEVIFGYIR